MMDSLPRSPRSASAGQWDSAYREPETAPWDIGRPQPIFIRLADSGAIRSPVLDAGCGSGENALFLASRGYDVTGVDIAPTAIAQARSKAEARGLTSATFLIGDAFGLGELGRRFATAIDSGLFHTFAPDRVGDYVAALYDALEPGAVVHLACFSDREPGDWGPRRVTEEELRAAFADGWRIESIEPVTFETRLESPRTDVQAWLAQIVRLPA